MVEEEQGPVGSRPGAFPAVGEHGVCSGLRCPGIWLGYPAPVFGLLQPALCTAVLPLRHNHVDPASRLSRRVFLHFLPFAIATIYLLGVLDTRTDAEITVLFQVQPFKERPTLFNTFHLLDLAALPLYLALSWRLLRRHQVQIADHYSYRYSVDYRWLQRLVIAMVVTWGVIDLPLLGSLFIDALTEQQSLTLGFSLTTLLVFYLGYHGFRQATVYATVPEPDAVSEPNTVPATVPEIATVPETEAISIETAMEPMPRYQKSGLSEDELEDGKVRLLTHMESEKPHLDNSLTIRDLAGTIGLSEHNLSEVINAGLAKTFYEFINSYRVEEFKQRVIRDDGTHRTLLAIALECGFNSKSSFNRIFKQHTGTTPSAYLRSLRDATSTS